jgi:hypothetical protein
VCSQIPLLSIVIKNTDIAFNYIRKPSPEMRFPRIPARSKRLEV